MRAEAVDSVETVETDEASEIASAGELTKVKVPRWFNASVCVFLVLPFLLLFQMEGLGLYQLSAYSWRPSTGVVLIGTCVLAQFSLLVSIFSWVYYRSSRDRVGLIAALGFTLVWVSEFQQAKFILDFFHEPETSVVWTNFASDLALSRFGCILYFILALGWLVLSRKRSSGLRFAMGLLAILVSIGAVLAFIGGLGWSVEISRRLAFDGAVASGIDLVIFLLLLGPGLLLQVGALNFSEGAFQRSIGLASIPLILSQFILAFFVDGIFDPEFVLALLLNLIIYVIPLWGLGIEYVRLRQSDALLADLRRVQKCLIEKSHALEQMNWQLANQVERRQAIEMALKESEEMKASILAGAIDGIITFDSAGAIIDVNPAAMNLFGLTSGTWKVNRSFSVGQLLPERYRNSWERRLRAGEINGLPLGKILYLSAVKQDGSEFPIEVALTAIQHGSRRVYAAFVRDITQRLRSQQEIVSAREEALRSSIAKSEFLTNMSHEIRTPLNAIIGLTDILGEVDSAAERQRYLGICRNAGATLLSVINDILDLSKLESGHFELERIGFDLHDAVKTTAEMMIVRAEQAGVSIKTFISPKVPRFVFGDPNRVSQILLNLIGNSVKFTRDGEIEIRLVCSDLNRNLLSIRSGGMGGLERRFHAEMVVSDTGIGIAEEQLPYIFEKFAQADSSITRKHGGTGLGLSICKKLVEAMGGQITVRSKLGEGAEFKVVIPFEATDAISSSASGSAFSSAEALMEFFGKDPALRSDLSLLSGHQEPLILLVDDSIDNQALIKAILRDVKVRLDFASNGVEACEMIKKGRYDLVFMDMQMPVQDGYSATREIRQYEERIRSEDGASIRTPIVALTAHAMRGEVQRSLSAGCDAHLSKPIRKNELVNFISQFVGLDVRRNTDHFVRSEKDEVDVVIGVGERESVGFNQLQKLNHRSLNELDCANRSGA